MDGFGFSLAAGTSLREDPAGFSLVSRLPVRLLRVNRPLFLLLRHIHEGGELSDFVKKNPDLNEGRLLATLLSLVARGYLRLDRIAGIDDYPGISIVIPVRNQPGDLGECLVSLAEMDYPADRLEVIAVDDGSRKEVADIITSSAVKIIREEKSLGPATCRNIGAEASTGDILAFVDADCIAGENWLRETVPFFNAAGVGAVGGRVSGYYHRSFLDHYEAAVSSLNLGNRLLFEGRSASGFYVPTANLLVRRDVFAAVGGFREGMRVGEDVDFSWRLRGLGHTLLYAPFGEVAHKHRNRLDRMLNRRFFYGSSEAPLYRAHRAKRKSLRIPLLSGLSLLAITIAILLLNPYPLCALVPFFASDLWLRSARTKKYDIGTGFWQLIYAGIRSYLSFFYFAFFHLVRYYLILFIGFGFLWHPLWIFGGTALIYASIVDYALKRPALFYPFFLFYYILEHIVYQVGVFWGCLRSRYFGSYRLSFRCS
jgi:mycofactocin system glycosyltransferase